MTEKTNNPKDRNMIEYDWQLHGSVRFQHPHPPNHGDIRKVYLPVDCYFKWSEAIPDDVDEDGVVISYKSGFIMEVVPEQKFVWNGQHNDFVCQTVENK